MNIKQAIELMRAAFVGQTDASGEHKANHCERVAKMAVALGCHRDVVIAAVLHDMLEDTSVGATELLGHGVSRKQLKIIEECTKCEKESYQDYISRLIDSGSREALLVKLLDNIDNTDFLRTVNLTPADRGRFAKRYMGVRWRLVDALARKKS